MTISLQWLASQFPGLNNLAPLSSGGQKLVFSADHATEGQVVLKLIQSHADAGRSERELLAVEHVNSPRVPRILANGQLETPLGRWIWIREQRITGNTVRALLERGPLPEPDVLRLGLHTLEALAQAEEAQIVHRDVKPDNLMRDASAQFWLLDFGIARHLALKSLTPTAQHFGAMTLGYAPPEQCRNLKPAIDARADLFALGVTLYECAVGSNPFTEGAADELEVIRRVEHLPLPPLRRHRSVPPAIEDLVATLTQKRRDHRPRTVQDALNWLQEICEAEGFSP